MDKLFYFLLILFLTQKMIYFWTLYVLNFRDTQEIKVFFPFYLH